MNIIIIITVNIAVNNNKQSQATISEIGTYRATKLGEIIESDDTNMVNIVVLVKQL